jgi:hypothetical protein
MQVTIDLEQDLWQAAREQAQSQQTTLDKTVSQLVRLGLAAGTSAGKAQAFTFSLPNGVVTADDVRATFEDEDE